MNNIFDVAIVGMGVSGVFATYQLATKHKNTKVIGFEIGKGPQKRRQQLLGYLGCLPSGDGKLYLNDLDKVVDLTGNRKVKTAHNQFSKILSNVGDFEITKDRSPNISLIKKLKKNGYDTYLNNYTQLYPKDIHALSKYMSSVIEINKNITCVFDNEVLQVYKNKKYFTLHTESKQEYYCKKLIIAGGRGGWRWVKDLYSKFDLIENNDVAHFGVRIETTSTQLKDFNKSNCTIIGNNLELGPFSWFGSIIPEDHTDMAITAFRSNEARWKSDKVSFNLIGARPFPGTGFEQTDRIGKLTFILTNDRILKERVSTLVAGRSKISIIPEYSWLKETLPELGLIIPEIMTKAYFYIPTISPMVPKINIGNDLSTEIDGMFVVGESAGIQGLLAAGVMGLIAADSVSK
jgi:thioredoxin reductase